MLSIACANSNADFDAAATFCSQFADWDAAMSPSHGVPADIVLSLFHSDTSDSLRAKFSAPPEALMLIARWEAAPAGCVAINAFDEATAEIHKFYVDPKFRGKGIGSALIGAALAEVSTTHRRRVVLHTAYYMENAIAVYEAFDFVRCDRFRPSPDIVSHTDVFMSRVI
jgi:GNAT superfamily N-acetyltransferase